MCELCAGIEKTHVELKKQVDSQWCGENIEIWKENNQAYLGYEGSAFPISFCPYCNQRLTLEEPLTVEELKQMDGEPVYVKHFKSSASIDDYGRWMVIKNCTPTREDPYVDFREIRLCAYYYGKTWLAYLHKPIEEEK